MKNRIGVLSHYFWGDAMANCQYVPAWHAVSPGLLSTGLLDHRILRRTLLALRR